MIDLIIEAFFAVVILLLFVACLAGALLMVRDAEVRHKERKAFKKFLDENNYTVIGKLTGVKRDE